MRRWTSTLRAALCICCYATTGFHSSYGQSSSDPLPDQLTFEQHVRPILREYCFDCHGAQPKLEGNLDLRLVRLMRQGGDSGPAIVTPQPDQTQPDQTQPDQAQPNQPATTSEDSLLLKMIASGDMPPGEAHVPTEKVEIVRQWLAAGAPTARPEPESIGPGIPLSLEDRQYWAYRPLNQPALPTLPPTVDTARLRSPIDHWLQAAMPEGLTFSPDADKRQLILRAYFDLIGLPPSAAELERWLTDTSDTWYTGLLDHLLESPQYGERWARHWLDVAGYADSDGYTLADADRPWAWKYRDYVIASLNADKPFDRFVIEQLAGDELAGPAEGDWTQAQIELLTATGFLRTAADGTGSGDDSPEARNKVIADTLKIVGSSLMGTSLHCAQCHDHRYDPISHLDYHAIRSVFEPALDWQQWKQPGGRMVSLYTAADRQKAAEIEQAAQEMSRARDSKRDEYMQQALDKELAKYEEPLRGQLRTAYETPGKDRTDQHKALLDKYPSVNITPGVLYQYLPQAAEELKKLDEQIAAKRAEKPVEEFVRVLTEPTDRAPLARLFHRGDHNQPQQEVAPAPPAVAVPEGEHIEFSADDPQLPTSGRRLAFARWLTQPGNPLLPRVIVNRVWMHHFGQGLVATPGEFGRLGSAPTHPELLDWLAAEFVKQGWSLKGLHRTIMQATAWRQSSYRDPERQAIDPDNFYYWRKNLQRLDAEIIRDRMLAAVGRLDTTLYGPPIAIKEDDAGQTIVDGSQTRRSLYIRQRRTQPVAMLQTFDAPVMETNCEYRPVSTVATQSLMLLNGEFTIEQAGHLAERVMREAAAISDSSPPAFELPMPDNDRWSYAVGRFDEAAQRVVDYRPLTHFVAGRWQGGPELPGGDSGYASWHAHGGHPGNAQYSIVRRWSAPATITVSLSGSLEHGSSNGDGVRGRLVASHQGQLGTWQALNQKTETSLPSITLQAGETLDFVIECQQHETSDSFLWPVKLTWTNDQGQSESADSVAEFRGPGLTAAQWQAQVSRAWQLVLGREPRADEVRAAAEFAASQLVELRRQRRGVPSGSTPERQLLVNLCQMLLNSNEFLYVD